MTLRRIALGFATFLCACFTGHGESLEPPSDLEEAPLTFRMYDFAGLDSEALETASEQTSALFRRAGVPIGWVLCRTNAHPQAPPCPFTSDPTVLAMRILAVPIPPFGADRHTIFGFAFPPGRNGFGNAAGVFWNRIREAAVNKKLNPASLLAAIVAHEAGHLLLGERSHFTVGIMKASWDDAEMRQIGQNALAFWPGQKDALHRAVRHRLETARSRSRPPTLAKAGGPRMGN
jgi:hypothetical protein